MNEQILIATDRNDFCDIACLGIKQVHGVDLFAMQMFRNDVRGVKVTSGIVAVTLL